MPDSGEKWILSLPVFSDLKACPIVSFWFIGLDEVKESSRVLSMHVPNVLQMRGLKCNFDHISGLHLSPKPKS